MMKKYLFSIAVVTVLLSLTGCSLEEYNPSKISTDQEWRTEAGYEKKVNDCYFDFIRIVYGQAEDTFVALSETGTDIWACPKEDVSSSGWDQVASYSNYGETTGMMGEAYSGFYGTLSACNAAIYYQDKVENASADKINALAAEAHYLRAHSLFNIVEFFGGKYLPTEPLTAPLKVLPTSSVNDFYKVILEDLDYAKKYLPLKQEVTGHVTRAAAYHLYAKACLTYATYTDGLASAAALTTAESNDYLQKAKVAADELINNASTYGVALYDNADEVFSAANNKTNKEALFVVTHSTIQAYNPRGNYYNRAWKHMCTWNANNAGIYMDCLTASYSTEVNGVAVERRAKGNCYYVPTKYLIDLYSNSRDTRFEAFFKVAFYNNKPNSGDNYVWVASDATRYGLNESRVANTKFNIPVGDTCVYLSRTPRTQTEKDACRYAIYNVDDNYTSPYSQKVPGRFAPSLKKGDLPEMYGGTNPSKAYTTADCIVYRLAETYLLSAEIDWRLGDNASAAQRINVIRKRANAAHDNSMDIASSDVTKEYLLEESARELCGEWNRWTTLKRFRAFETQLTHNPQIVSFNKDVNYLRAVPLMEINLIDNKEEYQNPGY